jgi:nicotinamidase-related amidase
MAHACLLGGVDRGTVLLGPVPQLDGADQQHALDILQRTALQPILTAAGCDTLVVTGASTSGCVRATVVDGVQHGLSVLVPREAVADRAQSAHDASLTDIDAKYGGGVSVDEAIAVLSSA